MEMVFYIFGRYALQNLKMSSFFGYKGEKGRKFQFSGFKLIDEKY